MPNLHHTTRHWLLAVEHTSYGNALFLNFTRHPPAIALGYRRSHGQEEFKYLRPSYLVQF